MMNNNASDFLNLNPGDEYQLYCLEAGGDIYVEFGSLGPGPNKDWIRVKYLGDGVEVIVDWIDDYKISRRIYIPEAPWSESDQPWMVLARKNNQSRFVRLRTRPIRRWD